MANVSLLPDSRNVPTHFNLSDRLAHRGGEGNIYFSNDGRFVVKIYHHAASDKQKLLQQVLNLGRHLGSDEQYLAWPLGIVRQLNGKPAIGVVTRRVPEYYVLLHELIYTPTDAVVQYRKGRSWLEYLKIARGTTAAVRTIHGKGMAHGDIHLKNFLANPVSGEVVMIDLDGLVVKGFLPSQVKGMSGFIAPEVMMDRNTPDESTDRYSTAILVLWILLLRNVMQTQICYDDEDVHHDDKLGYGKYACFSEHPTDRRNWIPRIGTPLFRKGLLSYRALTPKLQDLAERALIQGLHDRIKRPQVVEWERALAEAYDVLISCPTCRQSYFYQYWLKPPPRRQCPFCGAGVRPPYPAVLELMEARAKGTYVPVRHVTLYHGMPLFADVIESGALPPFTRRGTTMAGQTIWNPGNKVHRITNLSDVSWQIIAGGSGMVGRGSSVNLRKGLLISFGNGKRLAKVVE